MPVESACRSANFQLSETSNIHTEIEEVRDQIKEIMMMKKRQQQQQRAAAAARRSSADQEDSRSSTASSLTIRTIRYGECQKNHAASIGGYAVDGCREFMASGDEGTSLALICAACGCHRNFHRRVVETEVVCDCCCSSPDHTSNDM
ncbi:hypothetical protein Dimus_022215 [Dionaea muscipula]